ncbi:MAG: DDE-type integrase/transposase/recombinase [Bdellovibrionales bacterium]|jgi:putative transposase|nr:DDE-type integrase/transposase/recombinase [Bdellovibrionales bacterium]
MNEDIRKAIGLIRHQIISPVLMETGRGQMKYFREICRQEFEYPGGERKIFSAETMKGWLKSYRKHGFAGLVPKERSDRGLQRFAMGGLGAKIIELRQELMELSAAHFYRRCLKEKILGDPPLCEQTLRRFLKAQDLTNKNASSLKGRKRYEMDRFGELWVGDFMHGPILEAPKKKKAILFGIIDDHSRVIVGHRWSLVETTLPIEQVFKEAILKYGKPDRLYLDNGPSFSSKYLRTVCAQLGIGLIHSKPYDSPSRGKIERFWRTVREKFLVDFKGTSLRELNDSFDIWLRAEYHLVPHAGISCRPLDRYQVSLSEYPRPRVNEEVLEEFFLMEKIRRVNKDATISLNSLIYEVPTQYIGQKVQIRYRQDNQRELFLYEKDKRITAIKVVDARANGKKYQPRARATVISYQSEQK